MGEICPFIELRAFFIDRRRYYDRMLQILKEAKGEIFIKADGQVLIKVAGEEHLLEKMQQEKAKVFAVEVLLALGYFIDYR